MGRRLSPLYEGAGEESLRRFELVLLSELGYRVAWDSDELREPIRAEAHYRFEVDRGFCIAEGSAPSLGATACYQGCTSFASGSGGRERIHWVTRNWRC